MILKVSFEIDTAEMYYPEITLPNNIAQLFEENLELSGYYQMPGFIAGSGSVVEVPEANVD